MTNDLIDRQAAIDYINRALPDWSEDKEAAIDCLRNLPAVDAVPVVRCKDCKWWHDWNGECYGNGNMGYGVGRKADDFCSWGKRKDG